MVYGMDMKWVVGAVAYHTPKLNMEVNGFMGDDTFTLRTPENLKENWDDTHAWLEDEDGNVYDYITERDYEMTRLFDPYSRRYKMKEGLILGETYASLKKRGHELIPYNEEQRKVVLDILIERSKTKCPEYTEFLLQL
jgi:hypothetical protein